MGRPGKKGNGYEAAQRKLMTPILAQDVTLVFEHAAEFYPIGSHLPHIWLQKRERRGKMGKGKSWRTM